MIVIPGDMLEGGGQIVRTSIALSSLTSKEVQIDKIRDNRPNPGLQPQHVRAVETAAALSDAVTEGAVQGSRDLMFKPRSRIGGSFAFDVGTAGSVPLILQAVMPCTAFAPNPVELHLTGGTDVRWSPTIDYVRLVLLPILLIMGYTATLTVHRRGHYPKGGGKVAFKVDPPRKLSAIKLLERGKAVSLEGVSHCVKLPSHVAQRQAFAATKKLQSAGFEPKIAVETYPPGQDPHFAPGSGITLLLKSSSGSIIGADAIGERGKPAELVGEEAAGKLLSEIESNSPVDCHCGDMLIPYMAVAEGHSEILVSKITKHTMTNIKVTEMIAGVRFDVQGDLDQPGKIGVEGIGLTT
jgi:RNA 3'-terminal phosphate cyclase (ATP)